jgi:hypothetical protein
MVTEHYIKIIKEHLLPTQSTINQECLSFFVNFRLLLKQLELWFIHADWSIMTKNKKKTLIPQAIKF